MNGPVSSSMGGAGRAGREVTDTIFLNPATVALSPGLSAGVMYRDGQITRGERETAFAASIIENNPENFSPGGFAYVQRARRVPGAGPVEEQYILAAFGTGVTDQLVVGVSGYYLQQRQVGIREHKGFNGSFGAIYMVTSEFGVAYVFDNFVAPDKDLPETLWLPRAHTLGLNYQVPAMVRLVFDVTKPEHLNPDGKGILRFGAEFSGLPFVVWRMGATVDDVQKENFATAGVGFDGPRLRINYSFVKAWQGTTGALHSVDMQIPF